MTLCQALGAAARVWGLLWRVGAFLFGRRRASVRAHPGVDVNNSLL